MNKNSFNRRGDSLGRNQVRNEEMKQQTKDKIKKGALLYFAKYGYAGAKVSDLAQFIGISQGLLYRYFSSKEALFSDIINNWIMTRDSYYQDLFGEKCSSKNKIILITKHLKASLLADFEIAAVFTIMENRCLAHGPDDVFEKWASFPINILQKLILDGQKEGVCYEGDSWMMSYSYWGLFSSICRDYIAHGKITNYDFNLLNRLVLKEIEGNEI